MSGMNYRLGRATAILLLYVVGSLVSMAHAAVDHLLFGGDASYPPFESLQDGKPVGFNVELARAMGDAGKAEISYRLGDWPEMVRALESGEIDALAMFHSQEREAAFRFTSAFHYMHHSIYAARGAEPVYALTDLAGRRVAVEDRSFAHQRFESERIPVQLVLTANTHDAALALLDGRAEFAVLAVSATDELIRKNNLPVDRIGMRIWPIEYAFAVRKDRAELAEWIEQSLALAIGTGRYEEIYRRWEDRLEGRDNNPDANLREALRNAAFVIVPLLVLAGLATAWSWSLGRTVNSRTQELRAELERRVSAENTLRHLANHDPLTGLSEPHHFSEQADAWLREAVAHEKATVLVIKLSEIDKVASVFGYEVAERVIREMARRIREANQPACGYLGRGLFTVLTVNVSPKAYLDALTGEMSIGELEFHPSLVCGIARWPEHGESADRLVRRAETAMRVSRARKQESTVFEPAMEPNEQDLQIVADFRRARGEQLFAVFQPQINLADGSLVAAEALVRWTHPTYGFIPPDRFIPLLESTGLISQVTSRMLDEAVRVATKLRAHNIICPISVNVSAQDLINTGLAEVIDEVLARHGGVPGDLKLELTETSVAEDPERVREFLTQLSEKGIRVSLDDFGTGYSSLSYLTTFPISEVKIDRSFVNGVTQSAKNHSVVRSTILLARALGMTTVAEGAEDQETLDLLSSEGCHTVQGYVISRPLPEDALFEFIERRTSTASNEAPPLP